MDLSWIKSKKKRPIKKACIAKTCVDNPCDPKTTGCENIAGGGYKCKCKDGFKLDEGQEEDTNKKACIELDICTNGTANCPNTTECKTLQDDFYCKCIEGYKLKDGVSNETENKRDCIEITKCNIGTNPCPKDSTKCVATGNDFYCECIAGYRLKPRIQLHSNKDVCLPIDKCISILINGKCQGDHELCEEGSCTCEYGYSYKNRRRTCIVDLCKQNTCDDDTESCEEVGNVKLCSCKKGFFPGENGCTKPDNCTIMEPKCSQYCDNGVCHCAEQFQPEGHLCKQKENFKSCSNPKKCLPGNCVVTENGETCICPNATHVFEDDKCIDKCTANKLPDGICPGKCESDEKFGFVCVCEGKFTQSGPFCERKIMCNDEKIIETCSNLNSKCIEDVQSYEGYECKCDPGFDKRNNDSYCIPKCEIAKCEKKAALCVLNENFEPVCKCPPLFDKNDDGNCVEKAKFSYTGNFTVPRLTYQEQHRSYRRRTKRSVSTVDFYKLNKDFDKSLRDVYGEKLKDFTLMGCSDLDEDFTCDLELKFKDKPEQDYLNAIAASSVCVPLNTTSGYCAVYPTLIMRIPQKETFKKTDPCEESVKDMICGSMANCIKTDGINIKKDGDFFNCSCGRGYVSKRSYKPFANEPSYIDHCEDINECLKPVCRKNSTCSNFPGSYKCLCKVGYRNISEDIKNDGCIGVCENEPCGDHGKCHLHGEHGFACHCNEYYTGVYCNITNTLVKDLKQSGVTIPAIVGGVFAIVVVFILILGYIYYTRNKKEKKNNDDEYAKHRERAIQSEKNRLGWRQQLDLRDNGGSPDRRESGDYRHFRTSEPHIIPRPQISYTGGRPLPEVSDDRRRVDEKEIYITTDFDQRSGGEPRNQRSHGVDQTHRSSARPSDQSSGAQRKPSVQQFANPGFQND